MKKEAWYRLSLLKTGDYVHCHCSWATGTTGDSAISMQTFTAEKPLVENPDFEQQRGDAHQQLQELIQAQEIDPPVFPCFPGSGLSRTVSLSRAATGTLSTNRSRT